MKAPNHIVGGYVFTGLVSSLLGWNIFTDPVLLGVTFLGSLLPDVDHPKSLIGRTFFPISKVINRRYGHRTITHSVFFLVASSIVIALVNNLILVNYMAATYFVATFSHILFDMMTVSGVVFFYPLSKHVFVMPGKQELRISSNNYRAETIVMIVFLLCGFALFPLFKDGFWTTYNKTFSTLRHLNSEFVKADDMIYTVIEVKSGTISQKHSGYVILSSDNSVSIYDDKNSLFLSIPKEYQNVIAVEFYHVDNMSFSFNEKPDKSDVTIVIDDNLYCNLNKSFN